MLVSHPVRNSQLPQLAFTSRLLRSHRGAKQEEVTAVPSTTLMWPAPYVSVTVLMPVGIAAEPTASLTGSGPPCYAAGQPGLPTVCGHSESRSTATAQDSSTIGSIASKSARLSSVGWRSSTPPSAIACCVAAVMPRP